MTKRENLKPNKYQQDMICDYAYRVCTEFIERLPSADVRSVVRGKWIRKHDEVCYWSECSNCGDYPPKDFYGQEWLSHYCPNCGADMREYVTE